MSHPPRPTSTEVAAALARIRVRHDAIDDPQRAEMGTEPAHVLAYLRRRWAAGTNRTVAADDVWDELTLSAAVHWDEVERERALLRRARVLGLSLAELGAHVGIGTRQGMRDRLDRLDALVATGIPDEQHGRARRRDARTRPTQQRWLDEHHDRIRTVLARLIEQCDRALPPSTNTPDDEPVDAADSAGDLDWVDELRLEVDRGELTTATIAVLGLALGELRAHHTINSLDRSHGLHRALRDAERIRAHYDQSRGAKSPRDRAGRPDPSTPSTS